MLAAIDAGSNTLRLLIGDVIEGTISPELYVRRICRTAGGFTNKEGLSPEAMERTLFAFQEFAGICQSFNVQQVRAVGTAAYRQAVNGIDFVQRIKAATQLPLEVITGEIEAKTMSSGVLSALDPRPSHSLIVDIGGGSTEFVLTAKEEVLWSTSLPLGVVRLIEEHKSPVTRQETINESITSLCNDLHVVCSKHNIEPGSLIFVGTAGTVTTLAALDLQMEEYDWRLINNHIIPSAKLYEWQERLAPLSSVEREALSGMEAGRGDLIMAGIEILISLMTKMCADSITVSDFGLLEGLLLSMKSDS